MPAKVLVLIYSQLGELLAMATAVVEGARAGGATVTLKRVPSLAEGQALPAAVSSLPVATPDELPLFDAVIFGTPACYGTMAGAMKAFLDGASGLWASGKLVGRVGSVFVSTATQHGGQETTLTSFHTVLLHLGFIIVGLPYSWEGQSRIDQVSGGTPYGASTVCGAQGERAPTSNELEGARFQGRHVAVVAGKLFS